MSFTTKYRFKRALAAMFPGRGLERVTLFTFHLGRLHVRLQWRRPSSYGTVGARMLVLDTSWHDRNSWVFGSGYIGNRTTYVGWLLKSGHTDEPRLVSASLLSNNGNLPYTG